MRTIVFDGNSMTEAGYVAYVVEYLGAGYDSLNFGVSGQDTEEMAADAATQIDPLFVAGEVDILVAWEMTNDMALYATPGSTALAAFRAYCSARKAAGWTVVILDILPRNDGTNFEADRLNINATLRLDFPTPSALGDRVYRASGSTTWADVLVDVASIAELSDITDLTYYSDQVHPTVLGYHLVAADAANGVLEALEPVVPDPSQTAAAALLMVT